VYRRFYYQSQFLQKDDDIKTKDYDYAKDRAKDNMDYAKDKVKG